MLLRHWSESVAVALLYGHARYTCRVIGHVNHPAYRFMMALAVTALMCVRVDLSWTAI